MDTIKRDAKRTTSYTQHWTRSLGVNRYLGQQEEQEEEEKGENKYSCVVEELSINFYNRDLMMSCLNFNPKLTDNWC